MTADLQWHDGTTLTVEGRGWCDTESPYDRLPARARGVVRDPVWDLSRHSAGLCLRFVSDASAFTVRWSLRHEALAMDHMPATGVSGVDLYARTVDRSWRWLGVGRPLSFPENQSQVVAGLPSGERELLLYLPLYNGLTSVAVGVPVGSVLAAAPPRRAGRLRPVVFYGTSITQGGCASRPGMAHVALLGRWLDRPTINLGFSGNGTMDAQMGELMAELDPAVWVLDCLPNLDPEGVAQRTEPVVDRLRLAHPGTPIVLVEDRTCTNALLLPGMQEHHRRMRGVLAEAAARLRHRGVAHLYVLPGADLMGDDGEATVDGSHPTDLGFHRQAEVMLPLLRRLCDAEERMRH